MAKKYYVVKVGKSVGIYNNWEDCKKQVTGFSGAIYKSFPTLEEAKEYLNNENIEVKSSEFNLEDIAEDEIVAYVDGSYKKDTLEYGYGVVLILKGEVIELFGKGENPEVSKSRNVTGELFGSVRAIGEAIRLKKKK